MICTKAQIQQKMNLQGSEASDAKTLQSQNSQNAKIRILLNTELFTADPTIAGLR